MLDLVMHSCNMFSLTCWYNITPKWDRCITVTKGGGIISCPNALIRFSHDIANANDYEVDTSSAVNCLCSNNSTCVL